MLLSFDVKNQIITRTDSNRAIANSTDYFEVSVAFSSNWNGYDKTICFKNGDTEINIMLVDGTVPKEAHLNLGVGTWKVSVIGIKGNHKILTNAVNLPVGASGYIGTTGPTPRVYEELLTIIQSLHSEAASEAVVRSAVEKFVDENFHDIVISDVYSKSEIDSMILTKTVDDLVYYWNKSQTYNREEIEALIEAAIQGIYIVVETLPTTGISTHAIYLVPKASASTGDYYDEYVNTTGTRAGWEHIGSTEIDLSNYYTKSEINAFLDNKVDKVSGKGLSTNDYTNEEKDKLASIPEGAEANVQSDWNQTNTSADDYIKNKPSNLVSDANYVHTDNNYTTAEKTKLSGISANAKKVSESNINGNIQIDDTETQVYDDSEIQGDLSTAVVETSASNPLTFTTRSAQNAQSAEIILEPIQDLHGYDHPWPAGGGKNQLPMTVEGIKAANTSGTWSGNAYTINGVTFTIQTDDGVNVTGILINGNSTSVIPFILNPSFLLKSDSYILNGAPTSSGVETWRWQVNLGQQLNIDSGNGNSLTVSEDFPNALSFIRVGSGMNLQNVLFQPMIRLATETDPTFAPYSNICPISGHTEVSVGGCGKNWVFKTIQSSSVNNNGVIATASGDFDMQVAKVFKGETYTITSNELFVGAFYVDEPELNSQSYNGERLADVTRTFIAPIDGYVAFRTAHNYETPQLELGSQATDYEPYTPSNDLTNDLTKDLGQEVFGASYNPVSGELVVEKASIKLSDLIWIKQNTTNNNWRFKSSQSIQNIKIPTSAAYKIDNLCSVYQNVTANETWTADDTGIAINADASLFICDLNQADTTALGVVIANQTYCYELATPITYHLSPDEIKLLSGANTIWTDGTSIKIAYRDGKVATLGDLEGLTKKIADCEDVEITDLQAGDSLVWDATAGKWKNQQNTSMVVYDDTEQVIGTWFGETLYEKTIARNNLDWGNVNGVNSSTAHNITNIGNVVGLKMSCPVLGVASGDIIHDGKTGDAMASFRVNSTDVYCVGGTGFYSGSADRYWYITLQYTKTTDTAQNTLQMQSLQSNLAQLETQTLDTQAQADAEQTDKAETQAVEQTEDI